MATIAIFLAASTAFYFTLNFILLEQVDDDLKIEQREIAAYVKQYNRLPENMPVKDQIISYTPVAASFTNRILTTVDPKNDHRKHHEAFRQLQFGIVAGGQPYIVSVSKSLEETDDLIRLVAFISILTILAILIASFIINRVLLKRLWQPFNGSLEAVKKFSVSKEETLRLPATDIDEFGLMNGTLQELTQTAQLEYLSLKTFSENASHEIQTPIAIIQSKLDLLIQDEALTESQSKTVQAVYDAILRLSRLNSSLLLLAKIENKQYAEVERINLKAALEEKLTEFAELWQAQGIAVNDQLTEAFLVINPQLLEILLNNLLSNATRYNFTGGSIYITLLFDRFIISNTSKEPELRRDKLFQRFYKFSASSEGYGLGLSVIKQICDASSLSIRYDFYGGKHSFTIQWKD